MINRKLISKLLLVFSIILFTACGGFLIYYLLVQPHMSKEVQEKYRDVYYEDSSDYTDGYQELAPTASSSDNASETTSALDISLEAGYKKGAKDKQGRLKKFSRLLDYNSDVKGWLSIEGTCIDYPVLQTNYIDYYLTRDFEGNKDKNGSLYIDEHSTIEKGCKNIVIHGHNMITTGMMFVDLPQYKDINFYKKHPVITFDTLYDESKWKIISYMRVYGNPKASDGFNYMQGVFDSDEDFMNFLYEIELRSPYHCPVDVNENDTLLMLSTCIGELNDGRGVVVARKLRKGESADVNTSLAVNKGQTLYPAAWYHEYGGEPPIVTDFATAMSFGEVQWYDGELEIASIIGSEFEDEAFTYKITTANTVDLVSCKDKKATEIRIPDSVMYKDHELDITYSLAKCFENMKHLEKVTINNKITTIPDRAFTNCKKLKSVVIGEAVTTIGFKAFYDLPNLKKVFIKSNVLDKVDDKAFAKDKCTFKIDKDY